MSLSVLAGVCAYLLWAEPRLPSLPPPKNLANLLASSFPDDQKRMQALGQWKGKVLVLNFWATWCAPCREEMPDLMKVEASLGSRGVQIVGVAIDNPLAVSRYLLRTPVNYPVLVPGADAIDAVEQAGSPGGGLPYTVVIDRSGKWVASFLGRVDAAELTQTLSALL